MKREIHQIAMFVAAALNHPLPPCNGKGNISTIGISQYKTKFSQIRIYCNLADAELVKEYWSQLGNEGDPTQEFKYGCLISDAKHYRECYLSMSNLLSDAEARDALMEPANFPELLFKNLEELDAFLNKNLELSKQYSQYIANYYSRWQVKDFDALRKFLCDICGFKESYVG